MVHVITVCELLLSPPGEMRMHCNELRLYAYIFLHFRSHNSKYINPIFLEIFAHDRGIPGSALLEDCRDHDFMTQFLVYGVSAAALRCFVVQTLD